MMRRLLIAMAFLLAAVAPRAQAANTCTTCYIDYVNGSDSNDGTAETTGGGHGPWKHLPGMLGINTTGGSTGDGCTGNCASQVPTAGDKYIFKGGVVWPNTAQPIQFTWSGSSSTSTWGCAGTGCIYVGNAVGAGLPAWNAGVVTSITMTRDVGGWNPSSPPTISCSGGGGTGAAATPLVLPASATGSEPNVAGFIYHINLTSGGSGYTSAPTCTISGTNSYASPNTTVVADINRPIMDMGALNASPPDWPCGQNNFANPQDGPAPTFSGTYLIVYGLESRNVLCQEPSGGRNGAGTMGITGAHTGLYHSYMHGDFLDCVLPNQTVPPSGIATSCPGLNHDSGLDKGIYIQGSHIEIAYNTIENGDSFIVGTSAYTSNTICQGGGATTGAPCENGQMGIQSTTQSGYGPFSIHNNVEWGNSWQQQIATTDANGTSDPFLSYGNEFWLTLYEYTPSGHINRRYSEPSPPLDGGFTLISYNNIDHSHVGGSSNQQNCFSGVTYYFFNEVIWNFGTGTPAWSPTGGGGCTMYFLNDTVYGNQSNVSYACLNLIDGGGGTVTTLQNFHCFGGNNTAPNPFWETVSAGDTVKNYAGSTTTSVIQASSEVDTVENVNSQGYVATNLYAPTAATNETVTFQTSSNAANLTPLCTGYLVALCSDILGNARPNAAFQAGAYLYGGSAPGKLLPPLNLVLSAQ